MRKVVWIQDFDIITALGGAQLTDRTLFLEGVRRGIDMELATPQTGVHDTYPEGTVMVASNPTWLNVKVFDRFRQLGYPYIYFFHDYWPLCRWRLHYPMSEQCRTTCHTRNEWLPVLMNARMLCWMSPLHRESWLWSCPELADKPYALVPSPVDPQSFYPLGLDRDGVIAVQSLAVFKGRRRVLQWCNVYQDVPVTIIGGNPHPEEPLPANVTYIEHVPQHQLNELYNKHKSLLHLPTTPMPFDRTVAEAYLAGCDIIGNDLIGALSYDWWTSRKSVASHLVDSPHQFWNKVNEEVQQDEDHSLRNSGNGDQGVQEGPEGESPQRDQDEGLGRGPEEVDQES